VGEKMSLLDGNNDQGKECMVDCRVEGNIYILTLDGERFGEKTANQVWSHIGNEAVERVVFNFEKVGFFDGNGVNYIGGICEALDKRQVKWASFGLSENNKMLFRCLELDDLIDIHTTEKEAFERVSS
jgi:anti-anti-sigma regulatory factor